MTTPQTPTATNRIDRLFADCRQQGRAALILYLTAGYPDAETTRRVLPVLAEAGCDLLELGVPFSDPIADGPTIQRASTEALSNGMTLRGAFDLLREFRSSHDQAAIPFGAMNPFLAMGVDQCIREAKEAGADGFLVADLPIEEAEEFRTALRREGMHLVSLVAPTTPSARIRTIGERSSGFLYCISMKGTTGSLGGLSAEAAEYLARVRAGTDLPLALGFGISTPEHARAAVAAGADGVIVGSALIKCIDGARQAGQPVEQAVRDYVVSLREAVEG